MVQRAVGALSAPPDHVAKSAIPSVNKSVPRSVSTLAPILVWLRNDLRLDDHEPLHRAVTTGAAVVPVFCVDPRQFGALPHGAPKTGAFRAQFLIESLSAMRDACRSCGGELVIRVGTPEAVLPELARGLGATRVLHHEEVASEETTVEADVAAALAEVGATLEGLWGHTLYHPDDLPFALDALPPLFTRFRNLVERDTKIRQPLSAVTRFTTPSIDSGALPTLHSLGLTDPPVDERALFRPRGGEREAVARLTSFLWEHDRLRTYKDTRNGMLNVDDSSKLSPWLAMGCLSPRRVWTEVQRYERERVRNDSTYWLVFELLWRDYFRFVAAKEGDAIFSVDGLQRLALPWRSLDDRWAREDFERWTSGNTGFPLVDASMRELTLSGFTSNRARQNVASFLTKNLRIDWRAGAEWFESLLVDYDVASNWGNWTYAAGVGNDARGFRFFNLHKQALDYDPTGAFVRHWIPELRSIPNGAIHRPDKLTTAEQNRYDFAVGRDYPLPMVDLYESANANEILYRRATDSQPPSPRARSADNSRSRDSARNVRR